MMKISVFSQNELFARMLALEAEMKFPDAQTTVNVKSTHKCDVAVVDLDSKYAEYDFGAARIIGFSKNEKLIEQKLVKKCDLILHRPFLTSKLMEHIEIIKRGNFSELPNGDTDSLIFSEGRLVTVNGRGVHLSENEFALFRLLWENKGEPVSRDRIGQVLSSAEGNICDVYISKLRSKLEAESPVKLIYTVRGKGYMLKL